MTRRNFLSAGFTAAASGLLLPELIRPKVTTVVFGSGRRTVLQIDPIKLDGGGYIMSIEQMMNYLIRSFGIPHDQIRASSVVTSPSR
jgi:hypothetical protein